jgi:hypothetical protein
MGFDLCNRILKIQESIRSPLRVHQDSNSQSGGSLGSVEVHSFTPSHILRSMKCDSWASLLACTFASPCLGHKPKARVVTIMHDDVGANS